MVELGEATDVELGPSPTAASMALGAGGRDRALRPPASGAPVILAVEDIRMDHHPGIVYAIYLDAPGAQGVADDDRRAGFLSFFGVSPDETSSVREFDVTPVLGRLSEAGGALKSLTITFVPTGLDPPEGETAAPGEAVEGAVGANIHIGHVRLVTA